MSLLRESQRDAIVSALSITSDIWTLQDLVFFTESGWLDYFISYKEMDLFDPNYTKSPLVKEGRCYIRFRGHLRSIFTDRFYSIPGSMDATHVESRVGLGYDMLWPAEDTVEPIKDYYRRTGNNSSVFTDHDKMEMVNACQCGIGFEIVVVTRGHSPPTLAIQPQDEFEHPELLVSRTTDALGIEEVRKIQSHWSKLDPMMIDKGLKLSQYTLPEMNAEETKIAEVMMHPLESGFERGYVSRSNFYFAAEAITALGSKGLLSKMIQQGRRDYYKFFAEHINEMQYLRYPLDSLNAVNGLPPLKDYQRWYDIANSEYPGLVKTGFSFDGWQSRTSMAKLVWGRAIPGLPMISIPGATADYRLTPLENNAGKYFSIHGITFLSDEILRIFHNTPLASAISLGASEYDIQQLSYKDVKAMRDLLSGRIMPYTFVNDISESALRVLSDRDTFIYIYGTDQVAGYINRGFILGRRLVDNLLDIKEKEDPSAIPKELIKLLTLLD